MCYLCRIEFSYGMMNDELSYLVLIEEKRGTGYLLKSGFILFQ